jgi:TPR repeat protein
MNASVMSAPEMSPHCLSKTWRLLVLGVIVTVACVWPVLSRAQQAQPQPVGSVEHYRKLAEQGNAEAQAKLADLYREGKEVAQDLKESAKWYQKAAEQGVAAAQFRLGELMYEGKGLAKDLEGAAKWLQKAADQGYQAAKDKVNEMKSKTQDGLKDFNKALDMIR